jgi:hypothetical protein
MFTGPVKSLVKGRGTPPDAFLQELIDLARKWPVSVYAPNNDPEDVFTRLKPLLAPGGWTSLEHRRAALVECLRCLAGFESSWSWKCGVDTTNQTSMANIQGQETGIFQVSFDSLGLDDVKGTGDDLHQCVMKYCGALDVHKFIDTMKTNHEFAVIYCALLLRNNFYWDGPIKRHEIDSSLNKDAVAQFQTLLA